MAGSAGRNGGRLGLKVLKKFMKDNFSNNCSECLEYCAAEWEDLEGGSISKADALESRSCFVSCGHNGACTKKEWKDYKNLFVEYGVPFDFWNVESYSRGWNDN